MPTFYEILLQGSYLTCKGFVYGLWLGTGEKGKFYFYEDHDIKKESLSHRIKELIGLNPDTTYVVVDDVFKEVLEKHLKKDFPLKINMKVSGKINRVEMKFSFKVYDKQEAEKLKSIFFDLPEGLELNKDAEFKETVSPEVRGIETYAPAHDYVCESRGILSGDLDKIMDIHARGIRHSRAHMHFIDLELENE